MLSSAKRVRRSMRRARGVRIDARAEAVLVAEDVGEDDGGLAKVHDGEAIRLEARAEVGPAGDRRELFQQDETRGPAEGAEGLAVECVAQAGFRHGQHCHHGVVDAGSILFPRAALRPLLITRIINGQKLSARPIKAGRSRRSHRGKLRRFMDGECKGVFGPTGSDHNHPPNSGGKWLSGNESSILFPTN
jgi:hypothetical protein